MTPRRFLNFFRSPTGALTLFLLGLVVVLILVNSRRPSQQRVSLVPAKLFGKKDTAPQVPETVRRDMVPFDPKSANPKPEKYIDFPADYIAEGMDQLRGWFYTLIAIATALGGDAITGEQRRENRPISRSRKVSP